MSGRGRNGGDDCRISVRVSESDNGRGGPDQRGSVSGLDRTVVSENDVGLVTRVVPCFGSIVVLAVTFFRAAAV